MPQKDTLIKTTQGRQKKNVNEIIKEKIVVWAA